MSDKIEPALTPEEWGDALSDDDWEPTPSPNEGLVYQLSYIGWIEPSERRIPASIAILNAALLDSDPRKITREWVERLREVAGSQPLQGAVPALQFWASLADALESYLPPEPTSGAAS